MSFARERGEVADPLSQVAVVPIEKKRVIAFISASGLREKLLGVLDGVNRRGVGLVACPRFSFSRSRSSPPGAGQDPITFDWVFTWDGDFSENMPAYFVKWNCRMLCLALLGYSAVLVRYLSCGVPGTWKVLDPEPVYRFFDGSFGDSVVSYQALRDLIRGLDEVSLQPGKWSSDDSVEQASQGYEEDVVRPFPFVLSD